MTQFNYNIVKDIYNCYKIWLLLLLLIIITIIIIITVIYLAPFKRPKDAYVI